MSGSQRNTTTLITSHIQIEYTSRFETPPLQICRTMRSNTANDQSKADFQHSLRVYYQDTDTGGVVYHSRYLDFMERARYEWLRALGFNIRSLTDDYQIIFIIRAISIEYFKPAVLDDLLHISVSVTETGRSRIKFFQQIFCENPDNCLTSAAIDIICVRADTLRPVKLPDAVRAKLEGNT